MATDVARQEQIEVGRPSVTSMIWNQLRHANRGFWRAPIAAFFTIIFPLLFLLLLGALIGNQTLPNTNVRVAQFLTPAIAAFAATSASFTALAIGLAIDREEGILKRVRGTPLSPWMFMAARIGSTVWIAAVSVALMLTVGVVVFGVQLIPRTAPAALLTLVVGIGSFAALGLAVVALAPSQSATQAITNALIIPLAFVSDIFTVGADVPDWLEKIGWIFPLKHFANALGATFNPFETGPQFAWDHLAAMAAWGLAGTLVALRFFRWEPRPAGRSPRRHHEAEDAATTGTPVVQPVDESGRPGVFTLIAAQAGYATRAFVRNAASAFFIVGFPVMLVLLLPVVFGNPEMASRGGIHMTQFLAPVLAVYGAAMAAYADFSQRVAFARDQGVLKRIHGTPLPVWAFMAGRIAAAICVALISLVLTMAVGMLAYGVQLVPRALPGLMVSVVLGVACFAALGLAIAAIAPNAETVPTIANATLLPLAFFSDIFLISDNLPRWMEIVGSIFPLKHFANAVADGVNPTIPGAGFFADHLAVMALWLVAGVVLALRFWTWEPRERRASKPRRRRGGRRE
jgi:ABC-type multidrug transport system permease subunit